MLVIIMKIRAFTLIEVMVSVIIISVVGLSLLQIHSNHTRTFEFSLSRIDINEKASLVFNSYSKELEDKDRTLFEIIKLKYPNIKNDELEKILKEENVHIKKVEIAQIEPFASGNIVDEEDELDYSDAGAEGVELEPILLNRIDVKFKEAGTYLYSFEFEGMENMPTITQEPLIGGGDTTQNTQVQTNQETIQGNPPQLPSINQQNNNNQQMPQIPSSNSNTLPSIGGM